jgi:acetate kinase
MAEVVLCMNAGSSSLKFSLYRMGPDTEELLGNGSIEHIGLEGGRVSMKAGGKTVSRQQDFVDFTSAVQAAFRLLEEAGLPRPEAVGHRVVHGGAGLIRPAKVDEKLLAELGELSPFAPLHLPQEIEGMEAVKSRFPELPQVACFDTAFHRSMPELAQRYPLPRRLWDEGLRRYGFHGISYEYIMGVLGERPPSRVIIAHLGNGASMAAVKDGRPVDTTMGFSPTGGLMMGTRTGDIDPGVVLYLLGEKGYGYQELEHTVNREAGLLGVSGISRNMKVLLEKRRHEPAAAQAVEMFCYYLKKHIGALAAALEGLDLLVFTAGIGEKAAPVREIVCRGLRHLGIRLDPESNNRHADTITTPESPCAVRVIPTNEDLVIARRTYAMLG